MAKRACPSCFGSGHTAVLAPNMKKAVWIQRGSCPRCGGKGWIGIPSLREVLIIWLSKRDRNKLHKQYTCTTCQEEEDSK